jgi:hypothetical protein
MLFKTRNDRTCHSERREASGIIKELRPFTSFRMTKNSCATAYGKTLVAQVFNLCGAG